MGRGMQANENKQIYQITNNSDSFVFETINGIFYIAAFSSVNILEPKQYSPFLYEFSFSTENQNFIPDQRICNTIIHILQEFFTDTNKIVYYVCDSLDNKQYCRHRLFEIWYTKYSQNKYTKIDMQFPNYNISVIMHQQCVFYDSVLMDCNTGNIYKHLDSLK